MFSFAGQFVLLFALFLIVESSAKHLHGLVLVLVLGLLILTGNDQPGGDMSETHCRVGGIHALSARTRRAKNIDLELGRIDLYIYIVHLWQDSDGHRRGVYPPLVFCIGHPLHPVRPTFKF